MLRTASTLTTSCSGVYTVECAAAVVEATINESGLLPFEVVLVSERCFEARLHLYSCGKAAVSEK